jgi:hypothetical protein
VVWVERHLAHLNAEDLLLLADFMGRQFLQLIVNWAWLGSHASEAGSLFFFFRTNRIEVVITMVLYFMHARLASVSVFFLLYSLRCLECPNPSRSHRSLVLSTRFVEEVASRRIIFSSLINLNNASPHTLLGVL